MGVWLHPLYALAHAGILFWLVQTWRLSPRPGIRCAAAIAALTTAGLVYDNGLIGLGSVIGLGETLLTLSYPRYVLHAFVTPMMIFAMVQIAGAADIRVAQLPAVRWGAGIVSLLLIPVGIYEDLVGLKLVPVCFQGVVAAGGGPPIPSVTAVIVVLILGVALWRQRSWPWAFLAGLLMFIAAAIPASKFGLLPGNGGEVFFTAGYAASAARFARPRSVD
jgi:hypothetical protein